VLSYDLRNSSVLKVCSDGSDVIASGSIHLVLIISSVYAAAVVFIEAIAVSSLQMPTLCH